MTPLKLVILGGTGFVGRHLLARLAADGHAVTLLSRNLAAHPLRLLPPGVMLREVDVYDPTALKQAFAGQDAVINLVGILNERGDSGRVCCRRRALPLVPPRFQLSPILVPATTADPAKQRHEGRMVSRSPVRPQVSARVPE